jgi:hypothetical protein
MKSLVIGAGQVGSGLFEIISKEHESYLRDIEDFPMAGIEVLHICYPEHDGFEETTKKYIEEYKPRLTIINSSITVGTTSKCGENVVYSPVRGRHPNLATEMLVYPKFVSGKNISDVVTATEYFEKCGWTVHASNSPETLELLKLLSNIHMGLEVAWRQEVKRILNHFNVRSEDYTLWEQTYNDGYVELGQEHLVRSMMSPDPIGGHCILECNQILKSQFPSKAFDFIQESNEKAWGEQ